jgi:nitrate reductase assembly molybdenum cofactor insertion protein NarJ
MIMSPQESEIENQNRLLAEALEWRLISLLFYRPTPGWRREVSELAAITPDACLKLAAESAETEASEGLYHSIFGPGGPAPPREVSYCQMVQSGQLLAELSAYYDAFAYSPRVGEPLDHVSVESDFIAYLRVKEAYAVACGDLQRASVAAEAAEHFISEHLSDIAEPLANSLEHSGVSYLANAGVALARRAGPPRTKAAGLPVLQDTDDSAFQCGES